MGLASPLRRRGFLALWLAQLVSRLGDGIHEIALIWIVYELTGDPTLLGLVVAASTLPAAALSLPAGSLVDRYNRKHVLLAVAIARGAAVLAIPLVGPDGPLVATVIGVAVLTGGLEAFAGPARGAIVPNLVGPGELDAANALVELTRSASRVLYVVGGVAVAVVGPFGVFYLDAASFLAAGAIMLLIPAAAGATAPRPTTGASVGRTAADVRSGIAYLATHRLLPSVLALSVLTTLALAPLAVVLPFYVRTIAGGGSIAFGLLYGAVFAGIVLGAVVVGSLDSLVAAHRGRVIVGGVGLLGAALAATAVLPARSGAPLQTAALALAAFGVAFTVVNAPVQTLVQTTVPDERRGMVFAVFAAVTLPAIPIGALAAGPLLEAFAPTTVLLGQGALLALVAVPLAWTPLAEVGTRGRLRRAVGAGERGHG